MKDTITTLAAYKDFFWIIFTMTATIISILTYINVRKNIKQSLYDNILKVQLETYESLLQELKENSGGYLFSLDLENMMKFNLISHLVQMGIIQDEGLFHHINAAYVKMKDWDDGVISFEEEEIFQSLEAIEEITVFVEEEIPEEEIVEEKRTLKEKIKRKFRKVPMGKYTLTNIRGLLLYTPKSGKSYHVIYRNVHNVYLPRRMLRKLESFEKAYMGVIPSAMHRIILQEEDKVLRGRKGEEITIDFAKILNELISDKSTKILCRKYNSLKREIRKSLKIDAHW